MDNLTATVITDACHEGGGATKEIDLRLEKGRSNSNIGNRNVASGQEANEPSLEATAGTVGGVTGGGSLRSKNGGTSMIEMLQLEAKGQALAQAVVVVESVLHKMEEQVRFAVDSVIISSLRCVCE